MSIVLFPRSHSADLQRRSILAGAVTALITSILCLIVFLRFEQTPLAFATIGTRFSAADPRGTTGYDGQFFYFIARDGAASIPYLDGPTLRLQRIVYPVLARLLAFGSEDRIPWALVLINAAAQSIGASLLAYISGRFGGPAIISGILYGLWIGGQYAVRLDLSEPLCLAFALGALLLYGLGRMRWTVFLLILSVLTKELGFAIAAGIALHALSRRHIGWAALLIGGPALAFGSWWLILYLWLGTLPTIYPAAQGIRLIPYNGLFYENAPAELLLLLIWIALPSGLIFAAALLTAFRGRFTLGVWLAITCSGFVMFMPGVSWEDQLAAYRVAAPWLVGAVLFLAQHRRRLLYWLAGLTLTTFIFVPLSPLWFG
jgi:hypothetical protein